MALVTGYGTNVVLSIEMDEDMPTLYATKNGTKVELAYFTRDGELTLQNLDDDEIELLKEDLKLYDDQLQVG